LSVKYAINYGKKSNCLCLLVLELTTDVNIFVDPVSNRHALANKRYFRYLSLDAYDKRYLYAGAM